MRRLMMAAVVACSACGRVGFAIANDAAMDTASSDAGMLTYRDAVLADQPLGYWRLGDTGTTVHDETGRLDSTFVGTCPPVTGALTADPSGATMFDDACTFSLGAGFHFEGNAPYTIELWIDSVASTTQTQYIVMNEQRTNNGDAPIDGYALVLDSNGLYVERGIDQNVAGTVRVDEPAGFAHVVYIYDGAQLRLYTNSVLGMPSGDVRSLHAYTADLHIGGLPAVPAASALGSLDELAIYDYALDASRVMLHYHLGIDGPEPL